MADRRHHNENWVKISTPGNRELAQRALKKIKAERKGKKFILIKHPIKGFIEKEIIEE